MAVYQVTAINIRVTDFGEADKLLFVLSQQRGKLKVLAKGARKVGSKLSGRTELFVLSRMQLATGRNFEILTDAQIMESYSALRGDLNRLNLALYFVWLVEQISPLGVPNVKVFNLLVRSLEKLASGNLKNDLCETFEKSLAIFEGVAPPAFPKIISLKKYFEEYLDRIYPAYFGEVENIAP